MGKSNRNNQLKIETNSIKNYTLTKTIRYSESFRSGSFHQRNEIEENKNNKKFHIRTIDTGGGFGNGGKNIGGGGGGRGDDWDDDAFDFNEDENTLRHGWFRKIFPENFDQRAIQAIFDEWMRTARSFPT